MDFDIGFLLLFSWIPYSSSLHPTCLEADRMQNGLSDGKAVLVLLLMIDHRYISLMYLKMYINLYLI
jgi:hypothetical protein